VKSELKPTYRACTAHPPELVQTIATILTIPVPAAVPAVTSGSTPSTSATQGGNHV
jgi:hypothetical protein